MNKIILVGRLAKDVELRYTTGENPKAVGRFVLAVARPRKREEADFITCVAFGKIAETLDRYISKGNRLAIAGHLQTGSYEKDGRRIYTTDVIVDDFDFIEPRGGGSTTKPESAGNNGSAEYPPPGFAEEPVKLPF